MYKGSKKRRRALPPGLTPEEEKVLTKAKRRAYRIDLSLGSFLGTRFGWGAVIGLVPAYVSHNVENFRCHVADYAIVLATVPTSFLPSWSIVPAAPSSQICLPV